MGTSAHQLEAAPAPFRTRVPLAFTLLFPAFLLLAAVLGYPVLYSIYLSFVNAQLTRPNDQTLAGLSNYAALLDDPLFGQALAITLVITVGAVAVSFVLGLSFALLVDGLKGRLAGIRGLLLAPWVTPAIVVGFLFLYMFDQQAGVINLVLEAFGATDGRTAWLSDSTLSVVAVTVATIWTQTPFYLLMFAAALTAIPTEQRESMLIDGANRWNEFVHLTVPYLRNVMVVATLLMFIRNFNAFPIIWTMTQGGPVYSTSTLVVYVYRVAFQQFDFGYASAVGVVWLAVLLVLALAYVRFLRRTSLA
ncbi:MAG: sugar ABC transporter permease [Chloroflexi bacterium]|nr:sugar ABC transporter permease [Chloroflexota bacterium]